MPVGATPYTQERRRDYSLGGIITFRPNRSWEIFAKARELKNRLTQRIRNVDTVAPILETRISQQEKTKDINFGVTWLFNPMPGNKTKHNRPDLDGLINPLLDKKQLKLSLELVYQAWQLRIGTDSDPDPSFANVVSLTSSKFKSHSSKIIPSLSYGILDNLEMDMGFGFYF